VCNCKAAGVCSPFLTVVALAIVLQLVNEFAEGALGTTL